MVLKRKNGDPGINYLVNDGSLKLKSLSNKDIIIIGERHGYSGDEKLVLELCRVIKPDYVLVEGLADFKLYDLEAKREALKIPEKDLYYQDFTRHWIKLSIKAGDIPFIGMEYTNWDEENRNIKNLSYKESFKIREGHFLRLIRKYAKVGKVLAVCGDTHVRSIETDVLGPVSPLYSSYISDPKACIIRTAEGEIE